MWWRGGCLENGVAGSRLPHRLLQPVMEGEAVMDGTLPVDFTRSHNL